jgi:hypothetical protein
MEISNTGFGPLIIMDPIRTAPPAISAAFRNEYMAREKARALENAGISPEQISVAYRDSTVLSAANDPAIERATGEPDDPDRSRRLAEPGFYVRSQAEHLQNNGAVLLIVAPEPGQEDLIWSILAGNSVERLHVRPGEREFPPGHVAPTPNVPPSERYGDRQQTPWSIIRQRVGGLPMWAKAGMLVGAGALVLLSARKRQQ